MSENYTHLLVPLLPEFRPEPDAVSAFGQGIIDNGNVASPFVISFSPVTKGGPRERIMRNPMTGETINIRMPSRKSERPQTLSSPSEIVELAASQQEYDVSVSGEGIPRTPPFAVGYVENDTWMPMIEAYHLEIRCRIRSNIVRLFSLESEDDLHKPPDFTTFRPRFGEDCSVDEREGIFVHPESGAIRILNAGCGTFWIEFKLGKFIFPRLKDNGVNVLDDSVITLARKTFNCDFVQACDWG
jgi:hypothetical protein